VTQQKYFSHPSFSYFTFFFLNLTRETEIGTANRWKTNNRNPPGPMKVSKTNQKQVEINKSVTKKNQKKLMNFIF